MSEQTILITGAAGRIGQALRPRLARPGRTLRLLDTAPLDPGPAVEVLPPASITDLDAMRTACRGAAAVVHLAALPNENSWDRIVEVNLTGTQTVLAAAQAEGVRQLVLASSIHAVGFVHRSEAPPDGLPADVPARPDTYYGFSKAALEALGALHHERFGTPVICLRIGAFLDRPIDAATLPTWLSPDDMARLVEAALAADGYRLIWGISRNTRRWWSLTAGEAIGYHPQDDSERYAAELPPGPADELIGGFFCTAPLGEPMPDPRDC